MMNKHDHMTLNIGIMFSHFHENLCRYLTAPFDDQFRPLPEQPDDAKKAKLLRDAEAHRDMAMFEQAVLDAEDVDDPDRH